jgi:hypothetical protein
MHCFLVSAPSAPVLLLTSSRSHSVQIVWMKGHDEDIVNNVTLEYMYIGPCNSSNQNSLRQRKLLDELTNNTINISNLQEYSEYSFELMVSNPAGSRSIGMNKTTLGSSKL